ncbi:MAG: BrnT family toxin [Elusimicrobia bacterium]|nr:BrnT family toxin [Elusimicrobiota bacterium]
MDLRFDWDPTKAHNNQRKHGVMFVEASSVFFDEHGILIHDPDHSDEEHRYLLIGMSAKLRLLVVSHTYREEDRVIRLISARLADSAERRQYGGLKRP